MNEWAKNTPVGTRDYIYKDAQKRRAIEGVICHELKKRSYHEIITPVLEFYDVFCGSGRAVPQEDLYKLFDSKGRILALRHDMTTPIARVAATKLKSAYLPMKFYYNQSVLRQNEHLNGKRDEVTQCGAELIGISGKRADLEILIAAIEAMKAVAGDHFKIELGHIGICRAITKEITSDEEKLEQIRTQIEKKNFAALNDLLSKMDQDNPGVIMMKNLPRLFGDISVLRKARSQMPSKEAVALVDSLLDICQELIALGYEKYIAVDLGMVHHINYYTGLIFKGYLDGSGDNCLAGGRYDALSCQFGAEFPATGFAINIDSILDTLSREEISFENQLNPDAVIHYEEGCLKQANDLLEELSRQGKICELSVFNTLEETLEYAKQCKAKEKLYYVHDRTIEIFDMGEIVK